MASYETRGRTIRAEVSIPGSVRPLRQSFRADDDQPASIRRARRAAEAWAAAQEHRKDRGQRLKRGDATTTLTDYHDGQYLAIRGGGPAHRRKCDSYWRNHLEPNFGRHRLARLQTRDLDRWVRQHDRDGTLSPESIRGIIYYLKAVLNAAVKDGLIDVNVVLGMDPLPKVLPTARGRIIDAHEIELIVKASVEPYATLWLLAWTVGMRWNELAGLQVRDLLPGGRIDVVRVRNRDGSVRPATKNGKVRTVAVTDELAERLEQIAGARPGSAWLFVNPRSGEPVDYHRTYHRVWRPTLAAAGLDPANLPAPHDFRRSAVTNLKAAGMDLEDVAGVVGHSDIRMTLLYTRTVAGAHDRQREAMTRVRATG